MHETGNPEALWFGRDSARSFGMLHRPEVSSARGVVFCSPLGFEGAIAHRAFRHMADDVAARGIWALRFDYDGEGDSAGGPWEPQRVDAWIASIDAAVGVLRARGVTDVRLVGFRMGATLASVYASTHAGISSLVLWSPCARGANYVREVRALSRLSALARPPQRVSSEWFPEDSMEVVGFELAAQTLADISAIDLVEAAGSYPGAVLVVDRDDAPPNDDLVATLVESGARVDHHRMSGYEDFMTDDEQTSELPWPILRLIEDWLDNTTPVVEAEADRGVEAVIESQTVTIDDPFAGRLTAPAPIRDRVFEQAVWIDDQFFGVVTRPAGDAPIVRAAIVLANTGTANRIGPGRLHVGMARYWAGLGFTVVRVDLGGCGDTPHPGVEVPESAIAPERIDELQLVLEWVRQSTGFERVIAGGLCSGAFNAFQIAVRGYDIDDVLVINPGTFYVAPGLISTEKAVDSAHILTQGFLNTRKWKSAFRDRETRRRGVASIKKLFNARALSGLRVLAVESVRNSARRVGLPVKQSSVLSHDLEAMISRGVNVLVVFSAWEPAARYLHTVGGPACEALARGDGFDLVEIDGGDHTFLSPGAREAMFGVTTKYLEGRYGSPNPVPTTERAPSERHSLGQTAQNRE